MGMDIDSLVRINKEQLSTLEKTLGYRFTDLRLLQKALVHSSFAFEHLTVLDGLRMFLSSFRLPGEAQMIDRILQAFAEAISGKCEESKNGSLKLFSNDEKNKFLLNMIAIRFDFLCIKPRRQKRKLPRWVFIDSL